MYTKIKFTSNAVQKKHYISFYLFTLNNQIILQIYFHLYLSILAKSMKIIYSHNLTVMKLATYLWIN